MAKVERFEDLGIWKMAREICKLVYALSNQGLFARDFPLRGQIRRASGSIMDNIAEGFERSGNKEFIQFLAIAKGSAGEVRSQLYRAFDQTYITKEEFDNVIQQLYKTSGGIATLIKYLKESEMKGYKFKEPEIPYGLDDFPNPIEP